MTETTRWPMIPAKWFTPVIGAPRVVRVGCVHAMQFYEKPDSAEVIANDFATRPATNKASAHVCIDNNSIVQCVRDRDIAFAAPGANHDGIHLELAGYISQSRSQWLDFYGIALLALAADAMAQYCVKYALPVRKLTDAQVGDGVSKGICGHDQVSRVFKKSTHTDPGPNFPWDYYIASVQQFYLERTRKIA